MGSYLIKRFLMIIPTMIGITIVSFTVMRLAPGDPVALRAKDSKSESGGGKTGAQQTEDSIAQMKRLYKLDRPIWEQYFHWVKGLVVLDFGKSITIDKNRSAKDMIFERVPRSGILAILSIFLAYLMAIPLGIDSATHQFSLRDRIITTALFVLYSLPTFWVALILLVLFSKGGYYWMPQALRVFPVGDLHSDGADRMNSLGWLLDLGWHSVLPLACLTYGGLAYISRQMRSSMLEQIRADYVRTARAKGLSERMVVFKHAARNSLIPIVTMLASILPALIGGSIIIEQIFNIPGMGELAFRAILMRDYSIMMAVLTFSGVLTLLGILVSDLLYVVVNPRISFD